MKTSRTSATAPKKTKGQNTRRRILDAARQIFAEHPYNAASIRMIGAQGGFDYSLIHHYFPSKAELLEAVTAEVYVEYARQIPTWFHDLEKSPSLGRGLATLLDRMLDYSFENPDALQLMMQNVGARENLEIAAGLKYFPRFYTQLARELRERYGLTAPESQLMNWLYGISVFTANCVGAQEYHALVLGESQEGSQYRERVKNILMALFLPSLKEIFQAD